MSTKMMTTCVEKQHLRLEALHARYADDCASLLQVIEREVAERLKAGMHWDKMSDLHEIRWQLCMLAATLLHTEPEKISDVCDEVRQSRRPAGSTPEN